jgi:hypothetical protein
MPIYEYRCECGATFESLESFNTTRASCAELCQQKVPAAAAPPGRAIPVGQGRIERLISATGIRGTGHEAKAPVFDPVKRANRPGCDDCGADN